MSEREDISTVAVLQPCIAEAEFCADTGEYRILVDNLPLIAALDNDLLSAFRLQIKGMGKEMENSRMVQIWCPQSVLVDPIIKPTNVVLFDPANPNAKGPKQMAIANRDIWFTACQHLVQGIVFLIQNGVEVDRTLPLLPMCVQMKVELVGTPDAFIAFWDKKQEEGNEIWTDCSSMREFILRAERSRVGEAEA